MTLIVDADDTGRFSRRMRRILAQSKENAKRVGGGFWCKTYLRFGTALRGWFFVVRRQLRRAFLLGAGSGHRGREIPGLRQTGSLRALRSE
jgi:hypothetical protein